MLRPRRAVILASLIVVLVLMGVACGGEEATAPAVSPSPSVAATVSPAATQPVSPSLTPAATETAAATPTQSGPDGTSGWNVYTNTKYGYEIKYPPTAVVVAASGTPGETGSTDVTQATRIVIDIAPVPASGTIAFPFLITVQPNTERLSPEQYLQELKAASERAKEAGEVPVSLADQIQSEGPVSVGDIPAYRIIQSSVVRDDEVTYMTTDDFIYRVWYSTANNQADLQASDHYNTFQSILATFRFTQ